MQSFLDGTGEYTDFINGIAGAVRERLGEGYTVTLSRVTKNNSVELDCMTIREGDEAVTPSIYLNEFFESWIEGRTIGSIADSVIAFYRRYRGAFDVDSIGDFSFESMRNRIIFRLVGREYNEELLSDSPHILLGDLAVTFACLVDSGEAGTGTIRITNSHCESWKVGTGELLEHAKANTPQLLPYVLRDIGEVLKDLMARHKSCDDFEEDDEEELPDFEDGTMFDPLKGAMYVLSNVYATGGASCLLYDGVLDKVREQLGENFYILPSSVHEVIIVPDSRAGERECLEAMVKQVNKEHVPVVDMLSDEVYHYPENSFSLSD